MLGNKPAEEEEPPPLETRTPATQSSRQLKTENSTHESEEQLAGHRVNNAGLYTATFYSNIGSFFFGIAMGWSGGAERSVMERSSYGFTPSKVQWNYICILLTLGAMVWCLPTGFLLRFCGCKRTILAQLLPNTLGWCLTTWAQSISMLYAGHFILGMCGGAHCVAVPIYSAEISSVRNRGIMGACFYGACMVGVFYSFLMSTFLEIKIVNFLNLVLLLLGLLQLLMPESPAYYVKRGKMEHAENSLRFLRGKNHDVSKEMARLTRDPSSSVHDQHHSPEQGFKEVRTKLARVLVLAVLHKLSGGFIVIVYGHRLLACQMLSRTLAIGLGASGVVGFLVCLFLVERVGRKPLMIVMSAIMFFATIMLGIGFKLYLDNGGEIIRWVMYFCLVVFVSAYTVGLGTLTWLLTVELFLPPMRPLCCSLAATVSWLTASFAIYWYSYLNKVCRPYPFLIYAILAVCSLLFTLAYMPETKRISEYRIQQRMQNKNPPAPRNSEETEP
ncbi:glucose transporter type 3 [Drosophila kikkawai]|uniref:Glucose transporter type 3 n=1 Tax=Drosophila kikkawai TaxID=30033 RepID=A0A6P4HP76_DROKI|nr:glucose transporter type 3 [Drosophila kikkawai]